VGFCAGTRNRVEGTRKVNVADAGRKAPDVWLDVHTGKKRLRRRRD
jgi:hypothetical protein